jgi:hypothetical protein
LCCGIWAAIGGALPQLLLAPADTRFALLNRFDFFLAGVDEDRGSAPLLTSSSTSTVVVRSACDGSSLEDDLRSSFGRHLLVRHSLSSPHSLSCWIFRRKDFRPCLSHRELSEPPLAEALLRLCNALALRNRAHAPSDLRRLLVAVT